MRLSTNDGGSDFMYLTPNFPPGGTTTSSDYQPIWEKPLPKPPNADQSMRNTTKRNNEDVYNMSLSSNSTDYEKKKYFVLDKDYTMNPIAQT